MPVVRMERTVGGSGLSPPAAAVGAKRTTHCTRRSGEKDGRRKGGEGREKEARRRKGEEREEKARRMKGEESREEREKKEGRRKGGEREKKAGKKGRRRGVHSVCECMGITVLRCQVSAVDTVKNLYSTYVKTINT